MRFDTSLVQPVFSDTFARMRARSGLFSTVWLASAVAGLGYDLSAELMPDGAVLYYLGFFFFNIFLMGCITIAILESGGAVMNPRRWHVASIFAISLIFGLAVAVGLVLLVLPALFLTGRWFLSVPILFDENLSATDAMRESWRRLDQYWLSAAIVAVAGFLWQIGPLAVAMAVVPPDMMTRWALIGITNVISAAGWIFGIGAATTMYLMIPAPAPRAPEIFG